jgi:hypothetical protein
VTIGELLLPDAQSGRSLVGGPREEYFVRGEPDRWRSLVSWTALNELLDQRILSRPRLSLRDCSSAIAIRFAPG